MSGLVYQVIWVRQFANVFGNTVHSASLVTGVFMAGLGAGGYVLGRAGDRRFRVDPRQPLRMYALAELGIAAFGLALAVLLPRLGALSAAVSSYAPGDHGWSTLSLGSHALRYLVAIALIAPPTFLMGGTLTLLIRFLVATDLRSAAARVGVLYGANTAGAALGALVTDFALVPAFGIFATQLGAVALNAAAGLFALALFRRAEAAPAAAEPAPAAAPLQRGELAGTAAALLLSGFAAMGLEILWFRFLSSILGELRAVFSLLLAVMLTGLWLGAVLGARLHRRFGRPALLLLAAQCALAVVTLALFGLLDHRALAAAHTDGLRVAFAEAPAWRRVLIELWIDVRPAVIAAFAPAVLMGMSFPLANAHVQRAEEAVGGRAGLLYLANTAGNVLGAALVGFVILPAAGTQGTALLLAVAAAASAVPLHLSARGDAEARSSDGAFLVAIGAAAIAIASFNALPPGWLMRAAIPIGDEGGTRRVLTATEGVNETLAVIDLPGAYVQLYTNGHTMSSTAPKAQRYMRAFAHVPLLQLDAPDTALVICFGVGSTTHAASLHPSIQRLDVADLSRDVLEHAPWFAASNQNVLRDPRVHVFVNDGRHHLLTQPEGTYDLVTLEPPPISFAGVSALYSRELYALAKSRLKPNGYLTQWLPAYQVPEEAVRAAVRAFVDVFPASVLLSGDDNELILMGTRGPSIQMDLDAVAKRLGARPAVRADLDRIDLAEPIEIAGMFAASAATMTKATLGAGAVTDDRPALEHGVRSRLGERRMPRDLFDTSGIDAWCPGCAAKVSGLAAYLKVRGLVYASDWFLVTGRADLPPLELPADPELRAAVARSAYLTDLFGGAGAPLERTGIAHLREGRVEEAVGALQRAIFIGGENAGTLSWLGRAYALAGDFNGAAAVLERAVRLDPNVPATRFAFAWVLRHLNIVGGAVEQYRIGLMLDPLDADAHYELAVILQGAGDRAGAERELQAVLGIDPFHPRANLTLCKRNAAADRERARTACALAEAGGVEIPADLADRIRAPR